MSTVVDNRIVQMQFDNDQFEKGVSKSLGTIDKLKASLNFTGAGKGLDTISASANNLSNNGLASMAESVVKIASKFNLMGMIGMEAMKRISEAVVDVGAKLVNFAKDMSIGQINDGWDKYADKTEAVQTIMSATADQFDDTGKQMEYVNEQLDKLNWFTDETSYNFVDMVSNIGKFTSNGIALDSAVTDMQGIATWAAKSGQNAATASRAMYNLAQAIGVGSLKLMDWRSIETANMATKEFKESAIEAALEVGTLQKKADGLIYTLKTNKKGESTKVDITNFSTTLNDEWFTTDVIEKVLNKYGEATNKVYELSEAYGASATDILTFVENTKKGKNITDEMISDTLGTESQATISAFRKEIETLSSEQYEFGIQALRSAQEAKTFRDAINATKDAVSTGWMKTFELIFGDYETARVLWTDFANNLWDIFASGGEKRNNILSDWAASGYGALTNKLSKAKISVDAFETELTRVLTAHGVNIEELVNEYGSLEAAITSGGISANTVASSVRSAIDALIRGNKGGALEDAQKKLEEIQSVVTAVWRGDYGNQPDRFPKLEAAGYDAEYIQSLVEKGEFYKVTIDDLNDEILKNLDLTEEQIALLRELGNDEEALAKLTQRSGRDMFIESLNNSFTALLNVIDLVKESFHQFFPELNGGILKSFTEKLMNLTESWILFNDETGEWNKKGLALKKILDPLFSALSKLWGVMKSIGGLIKQFLTSFSPVFESVKNLSIAVLNLLDTMLGNTSTLLGSIDATKIFGNVAEIIASVINTVTNLINKLSGKIKDSGLGDVVSSIVEKVGNLTEKVKNFFKSFTEGDSEKALSVVEKIQNVFSTIWDIVKKVLEPLGEALSSFWDNLKQGWKNIDFSAGDFLSIAAGIKLLNSAAKGSAMDVLKAKFSSLSDSAGSLMDSIKGFLKGDISLTDMIFGGKKSLDIESIASALLKFAFAIGIVTIALIALSNLQWENLLNGLGAMAGGLIETVFSLLRFVDGLKNIEKKNLGAILVATGIAMLLFAGSLILTAIALKQFIKASQMEGAWEGLGMMAASIIVVTGVLAGLVNLCKDGGLMKAGAALVIAAFGLKVLAGALEKFVEIRQMEDAWKGFGMLAASLGAVALALILVAKLAGGGAAIAAAVAIVAVAFAAILLAVAIDIVILALPKLGEGLAAIGDGFLKLGEGLGEGFAAIINGVAEGIVTFCNAIKEGAVPVGEAFEILGNSIQLGLISIGQGIDSFLTSIGEGIKNVIVDIGTGIGTAFESINTAIANGMSLIGEGIGAGFDAIGEGIASGISKIGESIDEFGTHLSSVGSGVADLGSSIAEFGNGIRSLEGINWVETAVGFSKLAGGLKDLNKQKLAGKAEDIVGYTKALQSLADMADIFKSSAEKIVTTLGEIGEQAVMKFVTSIANHYDDSKTAGNNLAVVAINAISAYQTSFEILGGNIAAGLANGMYNRANEVQTAASYLGQISYNATAGAVQSNSPSRLFAKLGGFIGQGLANGMVGEDGHVASAAETMISKAIKIATESTAAIVDSINSSDDMVLTPVLDLSNVRKGANELNSMLDSSDAIALSASISRGFSSIQNGGEAPATVTLDSASLAALNNVKVNAGTPVIKFEGSLAQLAAVLHPYLEYETNRIGPSAIRG